MNNLPKVFRSVRNTRKVILPIVFGPVNNAQRIISRKYCEASEQIKPQNTSVPAETTNLEADEKQYEEEIKNKILGTALKFALDSGFTLNTLTQAAQACMYPGVIHGLFPQGGADLVHYFNIKCNEELVQQMKKNVVMKRGTATEETLRYSWHEESPPKDETKVPIEFIKDALMARLLMIEPYKKHWARALALQALPNNVPNSLATLLSLVDDICYHAGDRSVDFNWYIRRVGLAGIYKASELFFLTDTSPEYVATTNFVHTRLKDAEMIQSALNANPVSAAPQALSAAFTTAKNMLGINSLK